MSPFVLQLWLATRHYAGQRFLHLRMQPTGANAYPDFLLGVFISWALGLSRGCRHHCKFLSASSIGFCIIAAEPVSMVSRNTSSLNSLSAMGSSIFELHQPVDLFYRPIMLWMLLIPIGCSLGHKIVDFRLNLTWIFCP